MMPFSIRFGLVAALTCSGPLLKAQPAGDQSQELADILSTEQIQAASKKVQSVANAPADVVILRGSELRAQGYRTLGDAVGGIVGFRSNEDHAYQGLGVRGLYVLDDQNTRVLVLLDGHALNSPAELASGKLGEDFGLPLELVDRIEIVRGPASSLYGNNAFQALINVVSVDAAGSQGTPFKAGLSVGGNGLAELWMDGSAKAGSTSISLMLNGFQRTGTEQAYPELQAQPLPARLDREEQQSAYLRLQGNEWSFAGFCNSRTQVLASAPFGYQIGNQNNLYTNRRLSGDFRWEPHTETIHWMLRLFGDRNEFHDGFMPAPGRGSTGTLYDWDPDRSLGAEIQGRAQLSTRFSLTFGTEQRLHRFSGTTLADGGNQRIFSEVNYRIGNTYLEGNWQPLDQLSLVGGLQGAEWKPSTIFITVNGLDQGIAKTGITRLTPRFSAVWSPTSTDVLKLIYGQGFRFPTLYERYYTDGNALFPNSELKPEVMDSEQLCWSRRCTPALRVQASFSCFQWQHLAVSTEAPVGSEHFVYENSKNGIHGKSLETEATWRQGSSEISGGLGWYQWAQVNGRLDNVSAWNGVLKAMHHWGSWSLAGDARYVGSRENAATQSAVPGTWTLRASVRGEFSHGWGQLSLEDLTNSRRQDLVGPEYDPITRMMADGRSVRLTLGYKL